MLWGPVEVSRGGAANFERPPVSAMAVWVDDERRAPAHVLYVDGTLAWRGSGRERSPGGLGDEDFRADGGGSGTGRRRRDPIQNTGVGPHPRKKKIVRRSRRPKDSTTMGSIHVSNSLLTRFASNTTHAEL